MEQNQSQNNPVSNSTQAVQAAEHATPLPEHKEGSGKHSKVVFVVIGLIVTAVLAVLGYTLLSQQKAKEESQTDSTQVAVETVSPTIAPSPTPASESDEAEQIDVAFPTAEVNDVQKDLQGL